MFQRSSTIFLQGLVNVFIVFRVFQRFLNGILKVFDGVKRYLSTRLYRVHSMRGF